MFVISFNVTVVLMEDISRLSKGFKEIIKWRRHHEGQSSYGRYELARN